MDKKLPTIVHIVAHYPPHLGGMERVAQTLAEMLAKLGNRVLVLTSSNGILNWGVERRENLTIKKLMSLEIEHIPFAPTLLWHLFRIPKNSIMHLHLSQAYWPDLVLFIARIRKIPLVIHFHLDVGPSGRFGKIFTIYQKITWGPLLRYANKVIVCSSDLSTTVQMKYKVIASKIIVLPNAVSEDFFSNRAYQPSKDLFRLLYIGRLAHQKCVDRLIEAMALLKIPAQLTIIGDGEDKQKLETLAYQKKLDNIFFVGVKNDKEMKFYHANSDALLISSSREGRSLVMLEAMAGGLPIIGTNVIGIRELLNNTGVLIDEPYPSEFAKAIETLWNNPSHLKELSRLSKEKARKNTWNEFILILQKVYQGLKS